MKELPKLEALSNEEKDVLIRKLWDRVQELEGKQKKAEKTSENSSLPPSKEFKENKGKEEKSKKKSVERHRRGGRELDPNPDQIVIAHAKVCPHCQTEVRAEDQKLTGIYDRIELPLVKAIVTRVERHGGTCPCCYEKYEAPVPKGLEAGSPFGDSVAIMLSYLRYSQGISYERLSRLMGELYGLKISEGAIASLLKRTKQKLEMPMERILERLQSADLVGSDETSARVNGKNWWEWVFQNKQVCFHIIRPSRGKKVIEEVMDGHHPQTWVSDLFSAQKANPGENWQVCLAHQLRDCQYAIDSGDDLFAPRMKRLFLQAIALQRRRSQLAPSTVKQYCSRFRTSLKTILKLQPTNEEGQKLLRRYQDITEHLLLFLDDESVPPTNNASEQALRWSVIFRKITNCFRSEWGADLFAMIRSLFGTAYRQGISAFDAISLAFTSSHPDWLLG